MTWKSIQGSKLEVGELYWLRRKWPLNGKFYVILVDVRQGINEVELYSIEETDMYEGHVRLYSDFLDSVTHFIHVPRPSRELE